jgi:hypothetical protein
MNFFVTSNSSSPTLADPPSKFRANWSVIASLYPSNFFRNGSHPACLRISLVSPYFGRASKSAYVSGSWRFATMALLGITGEVYRWQRRLDKGDEGREWDGEWSREENHMKIFELSWRLIGCRNMMEVVRGCRVIISESNRT